jgi:predicted ATPase
MVHQHRGERRATHAMVEAVIALSTEQGFAFWLAHGTILRGRALAEQGNAAEGIPLRRQGLSAWQATGAKVNNSYWMALLAEGHAKAGRVEEGLAVIAEALAVVQSTEEHWWEAELYRLKGELTLQKCQVSSF